MKYSILMCITALAIRTVNCGILYGLQYPYLMPYAFRYSYLNSPSSVLNPQTYTTSDTIIKEYIVKHHHPDHHGTDDNWKPSSESTQFQSTDTTSPQSQSADTLSANKQQNDNNKSPIIPVQATGNVDAEANGPINQLKYVLLSARTTYTIPTPLTWPTAAQFHHQDNIGQYYYGYANPISSKQEIQTIDGITRGAYSFIDANGKLQTVTYISDDINGFRVAATNLPKAPETINIPESPDIVTAKEEHFQAQKEALDRLNAVNSNTPDDNTPHGDGNNLNSE